MLYKPLTRGGAAAYRSGMSAPDPHRPRHPIRVVADRTGLTFETLRAWERRYAVVAPGRTDGGQRLYSDVDVERLRLLRRATQGGRSISQVAALDGEELAALVREDDRAAVGQIHLPPTTPDATVHLVESVAATRALDAAALEAALGRGVVVLGLHAFVDGVVAPLLRHLGEGWREGELSVAHEHLASAVVRRVLGSLLSAAAPPATAPALVCATPAGQVHEFGALLTAVTASAAGWRVVYLGADLPAADIALAARHAGAGTVALSIVHPADDPHLPGELRRLRQLLGDGVRLLVGGGASTPLAGVLASLGALRVDTLAELRGILAVPGAGSAGAG